MKINKKIIRLKRYTKLLFHCERSVAILVALALVLSFSLVTAVPVGAQGVTYTVDDDWQVGDPPYAEDTDGDTDFATINAAINAAGSGDTINVSAGTYHENLLINKALTLTGTDGAMGTIIYGNTLYMIKIQHSDVTFEGFTVTNPDYIGSDVSGILIQSTGAISNVQILDNIITQMGIPGMYGAAGINIGTGPVDNVTISENTITDIKTLGDHVGSSPSDHTCGINIWDGASNVVISDNTISDIKYNGIILEGASNVQIYENDITSCESGVRVNPRGSEISNIQIYENDITGCEYGISVVRLGDPLYPLSDLTINLNSFADNPIQVLDDAQFLDIQGVLGTNYFDRAVVVDYKGGSLLHTIWSNIQDGVDAALSGDTINVAAGTYPENVTILPGKDNLQLLGSGSDVTSIAPTGGRPVTLLGWVGLIDGFRIQGFTLVTDGALHAFLAGSGTPNSSIYNKNLEFEDIVVNGGQRGIGLNAVQGVTFDNVHLSNITGSGEGALEMTGVENLTFTGGSIEGNDIGVRLQPTDSGDVGEGYGPNNNIQIHDSSLVGNIIAVENQDATTIIDATDNWWGDASGPHHPTNNPGGSGNKVSDNVNFIPFLASSGGEVVDDVSITISGPTSANSGNDITYTITYKNIGTNYATKVVITEKYPPEVKFVSADPAPDQGKKKWTIGTLAPGEGGTIKVTVHIKLN